MLFVFSSLTLSFSSDSTTSKKNVVNEKSSIQSWIDQWNTSHQVRQKRPVDLSSFTQLYFDARFVDRCAIRGQARPATIHHAQFIRRSRSVSQHAHQREFTIGSSKGIITCQFKEFSQRQVRTRHRSRSKQRRHSFLAHLPRVRRVPCKRIIRWPTGCCTGLHASKLNRPSERHRSFVHFDRFSPTC